MNEITHCEVCGNTQLRSVLDLGSHPLCDDLIPIISTRVCKEYPIEILFCDVCLTAHQRFQVPKRELFKSTYHYRARMTGSVLSGMAELVSSCELKLAGLKGKTVLDIGCNDGSLLNYFEENDPNLYQLEDGLNHLDMESNVVGVVFEVIETSCETN